MVIGLLVIAAIPTTIGVCEALSAQKKADAAAKEKAKFHLTVTVSLDGKRPVECWCILKDGRFWIDHPAFPMPGHKFTGYYFTYPSEAQHLGMVSTIADDPPMLNWIFVDKDTHMVRHGGRGETLGGHIIGPWYWSADEQRLTLEGDDSNFVAVQDENKKWSIAWDRDGSIRGSNGTDEGEEGGKAQGGSKKRPQLWLPIKLHRRLQLGMESRYVKGDKGDREG
ncbi:hypothetical protein B0T17DRAFT_493422 [Bombardia bombarda]|uniref:Uncharacterized protein n=1 Tax=Bombardia bombarda TaxID=252184 RepID=A0AA40C1S5_9PEZI|nr:hypothetical protein B0T17DRAFT_493422 [Bombardia bombarda]